VHQGKAKLSRVNRAEDGIYCCHILKLLSLLKIYRVDAVPELLTGIYHTVSVSNGKVVLSGSVWLVGKQGLKPGQAVPGR
jgi:hypothetical protein